MTLKNKKNHKIIVFFLISFLFFSVLSSQLTNANHPHSIKGVLYINEEISSSGIEIKLIFPDGTEHTTTYSYNQYGDYTNYNLGFWGHEGQTGSFVVSYQGKDYIPLYNQTITIKDEEIGYIRDLYVTISVPENHPPDKPTDPLPSNNTADVDLNPALSVYVFDPDNDKMRVTFFDGEDDSVLQQLVGVDSDSRVEITWSNLEYNSSYSWYAITNDSNLETRSDTWIFKTMEETPSPPTVKVVKPIKGKAYVNDKEAFNWFLPCPLVIGDITVQVNITPHGSELKRVEFYVNNNLRCNDTIAPYNFTWEKTKVKLFHLFLLKVKIYHKNGNIEEHSQWVRKYF